MMLCDRKGDDDSLDKSSTTNGCYISVDPSTRTSTTITSSTSALFLPGDTRSSVLGGIRGRDGDLPLLLTTGRSDTVGIVVVEGAGDPRSAER